jgi:hypothetical protein
MVLQHRDRGRGPPRPKLEIAEAFEWLAAQREREPVWRVERVKPKK